MKILLVSIPNHHFFQWTNQLKNAGHDVYWFDITDGAGFSTKIDWVTQYPGWKLKWNFPYRQKLKSTFPSIYQFINRWNENKLESTFNRLLENLQPDVVHCFEMQLTGFKIEPILRLHPAIKVIYSSWGSDIFYFIQRGYRIEQVKQFLSFVDYLITDCKRDSQLAIDYGFKKQFLGVYPGNGGIDFDNYKIKAISDRKWILVKGYNYDVGRSLYAVKAVEELVSKTKTKFSLFVYSADEEVVNYIKESLLLKQIECRIIPRNITLPNKELLSIMGESLIHIGNNMSDGMPNSTLEAMGMGAFPIQSNPGGATSEIIEHGINGYLIEDPEETKNICNLVQRALEDVKLLESALEYNTKFLRTHYNRLDLQNKIINLYHQIQEECKYPS